MNDWISVNKDEKHITREREKARNLKKSQWWFNQIEKGICHYCGQKVGAEQLTLDHIVPVAREGKSNKGNCVPCCDACNKDKSLLTPAEIILNRLKQEQEEKE